jgi:hypothetical protein
LPGEYIKSACFLYPYCILIEQSAENRKKMG